MQALYVIFCKKVKCHNKAMLREHLNSNFTEIRRNHHGKAKFCELKFKRNEVPDCTILCDAHLSAF